MVTLNDTYIITNYQRTLTPPLKFLKSWYKKMYSKPVCQIFPIRIMLVHKNKSKPTFLFTFFFFFGFAYLKISNVDSRERKLRRLNKLKKRKEKLFFGTHLLSWKTHPPRSSGSDLHNKYEFANSTPLPRNTFTQ